MTEKMNTPGERAETTYLNIIGALGLRRVDLRKSNPHLPLIDKHRERVAVGNVCDFALQCGHGSEHRQQCEEPQADEPKSPNVFHSPFLRALDLPLGGVLRSHIGLWRTEHTIFEFVME